MIKAREKYDFIIVHETWMSSYGMHCVGMTIVTSFHVERYYFEMWFYYGTKYGWKQNAFISTFMRP